MLDAGRPTLVYFPPTVQDVQQDAFHLATGKRSVHGIGGDRVRGCRLRDDSEGGEASAYTLPFDASRCTVSDSRCAGACRLCAAHRVYSMPSFIGFTPPDTSGEVYWGKQEKHDLLDYVDELVLTAQPSKRLKWFPREVEEISRMGVAGVEVSCGSFAHLSDSHRYIPGSTQPQRS